MRKNADQNIASSQINREDEGKCDMQFRQIRQEDFNEMEELEKNDSQIRRFLSFSRKEKNTIYNLIQSKSYLWFAIMKGREMVGDICCEREGESVWIAIRIYQQFRRRGIASQSVLSVPRLLREEYSWEFNKLAVGVEKENVGSLKLFQSLGFAYIGQDKDGVWELEKHV